MSKRLWEGPPLPEDPAAAAPPAPGPLPEQASLLALFPAVLTCLLGGQLAVAETVAYNTPYTLGRLKLAWTQLVEGQPRAAFQVAVEAFGLGDYSHFLPADGSPLDQAIRAANAPVGKEGKSLLFPALQFPDQRADPPTLPTCTMKDLSPEEHLTLALATANALIGENPAVVPPTIYGWLQSAVIVHMRHHELCLLAHEMVSEALFEGAFPFVEEFLGNVPDSFIVDVLVYEPQARHHLDLDEWIAILWNDSARELVPVRPRVQQRLRATGITLHPYQKACVQWAAERELLPPVDGKRFSGGEFAILPGMGKTRIALALAALDRGQGPTLVLAPLAVISDWVAENERANAGLTLRIYHNDFDGTYSSDWRKWVEPGSGVDLIISTVQTFSGNASLSEYTPVNTIHRVIIDEMHLLSNVQTKGYKALMQILQPIPRRWGLTGTPFKNARADLVAQLRLLGWPGTNQEKVLKHLYQLEYGPETVERGPRSVEIVEVPLNAYEWDLYRQIYVYGKNLRDSGAKFARLQAAMMRMRQAAISLELVPLVDLEKMRAEAVEEQDRQQGVVWALFTRASRALGFLATPFTATIVPGYVSSRIAAVIEKLDEIALKFPNDKILVFSSFAKVFANLAMHMRAGPARPWRFGIYDGSLTTKKRRELRAEFDSDPSLRTLFITYGAGAAGMNLQVATHVLEIDPCFNDATLNQAEARAWRIRTGPPRLVRMYRFVAPKTYEVRMEAIRASKRGDWNDFQGLPADGEEKEDVVPEDMMGAIFSD
jgi:SNF2 family DNA or RNA helicase